MAENIKVAVRVRPFNDREKKIGGDCVISMSGKDTIVQSSPAPKTFSFDFSYWSVNENDANYASQDTVMNDIGQVIVDNAMKGFNGCLFAYGQTGSGKSYSVIGYANAPGIVPKGVQAIFEQRAKLNPKTDEVRIRISFLEIYNEQIRDLLHPSSDVVEMKVMDHPELGVYVPGLTESPCDDVSDVDKLMDFGSKKRVTASTNMNATSSRSHAVFTVRVQRLVGNKPADDKKKDDRKILNAKINLVDLAGSERVSKTGAEGSTLKEGCAINMSLSALGQVIRELSEAGAKKGAGKGKKPLKETVAFRASKLTFLLRDSLCGNSKTYMMAAISPSADNLEESIGTLRFAASVKKIKTVAKQNVDKKDEMISNLQAELKKLKQEAVNGGVDTEDHDEHIAEHQKLLDEYKKSHSMQLEEADRVQALRDEAMMDLGLTAKEMAEAFGMDSSVPYLLNINDDKLLAGCLLYYLPQGSPITVGNDSENKIVLTGLGIPPSLCTIVNNGQTVTIQIPALHPEDSVVKQARVVVNGTSIKNAEPVRIKHGDKLFFGRAAAMQIFEPDKLKRMQEGYEDVIPEDLHTTDLIKSLVPEDSEAWGELQLYLDDLWQRVGEERGRVLFEHLTEASHLVDEANEITEHLRRDERLKFEVELVWDIHRSDTKDIIVIRLLKIAPDGQNVKVVSYWTLDKFKARLDSMRDCFDQHHNDGSWEGYGDSLEDPWIDPSINELKVRLHAKVDVDSQRRLGDTGTDVQAVYAEAPPPSAGGTPNAPLPGKRIMKSASGTKLVSDGQAAAVKRLANARAANSFLSFGSDGADETSTGARSNTRAEEPFESEMDDVPARNGMNGITSMAAASLRPSPFQRVEGDSSSGPNPNQVPKEDLIAAMREQLKDKEDKEDLYKSRIHNLEDMLNLYEQHLASKHARDRDDAVSHVSHISTFSQPQYAGAPLVTSYSALPQEVIASYSALPQEVPSPQRRPTRTLYSSASVPALPRRALSPSPASVTRHGSSVSVSMGVCSCGNAFMSDSAFCRKCGSKRGEQQQQVAVAIGVCSCGNTFMSDSAFCRKCGSRRGEQIIAGSAAPTPSYIRMPYGQP